MTSSINIALRDLVHGDVHGSSDPGFAQLHQGFNLALQHRPDVVVSALDAPDVATAVRIGAEHQLSVRVQATGHGIGIPMAGGVLVNTAAMRRVTVDPVRRTATVGAGALWQEVIAAAGKHGLATLCGSSPTVGVVGYTLGGGMGPMARTFGFASDRVRRIQMVDVTGQILDIDAEHEPELFWALRGGKPDIGIVTELEFELIDLPTYYGGSIFFPGDNAPEILHEFSQWAPGLPQSASTSIALLRMPDTPQIPEPLRGRLSVHLRYVHVGDPSHGAELLSPMRAATPPLIDLVDETPCAAIATVHQDPVDPMAARDEGMLLNDFDEDAVGALTDAAGPDVEVPLILAEVRLMGGALVHAGEHDSAVGGRDGAFSFCVIRPYPPPLVEAVDASSKAVLDAMRPWATGRSLINFQGSATRPEEIRAAWDDSARDRLDRMKHSWDPSGVFQFSYSTP